MTTNPPTLTKKEIVGKLTGHPDVSRVLATDLMELFIRIVRWHFENGGQKVLISGLGVFTLSKRKASETVHPMDKSLRIKIKATKRVTFKCSEDFLGAINRR